MELTEQEKNLIYANRAAAKNDSRKKMRKVLLILMGLIVFDFILWVLKIIPTGGATAVMLGAYAVYSYGCFRILKKERIIAKEMKDSGL